MSNKKKPDDTGVIAGKTKKRSLSKKQKALSLISAVFVFGVIGFLGVSIAERSGTDAAANLDTSLNVGTYTVSLQERKGCVLSGRKWDSDKNDCLPQCRAGANLKTEGNKRFCQGFVNIDNDAQKCVQKLHRYYIKGLGCSRRADQDNTKDANQCVPGYPNYVASGNVDYCDAPAAPSGGGNAPGNSTPAVNNAGGNASQGPAQQPPKNPEPQSENTNGISRADILGFGNKENCELAGRKWQNGGCQAECNPGNGNFDRVNKFGTPRGYCKQAVNPEIDAQRCVLKLHRKYFSETGCARNPAQKDQDDPARCATGYLKYIGSAQTDRCEVAPGSPAEEEEQTPGDVSDNVPADTLTEENGAVSLQEDFSGVSASHIVLPGQSGKIGCELIGRVWGEKRDGSGDMICRTHECISPVATYKRSIIFGAARSYCEGSISFNISPQECVNDLHRLYVRGFGCARLTSQVVTKNALQCIDGYPQYSTVGAVDECVANETAIPDDAASANNDGQASPSIPSIIDPAEARKPGAGLSKREVCELSGLTWNASKKECRNKCVSGKLWRDLSTKRYYCTGHVAPRGTKENCENKLHRKWLGTGCARVKDQKDTNNARQCLPGYPYYNADFKSSQRDTKIDVCEKSKAAAVANEQNNVLGFTGSVEEVKDDEEPVLPGDQCLGDDSDQSNPGCIPTEELEDGVVSSTTDPAVESDCQTAPAAEGEEVGSVRCYDDVPFNSVDQEKLRFVIDPTINEQTCRALGRVWLGNIRFSDNTRQFAGCSTERCRGGVKMAEIKNGFKYCDGYVDRTIKKNECKKLHRLWINKASGCAQFPNQQRKNITVVKADQCVKPHTTYIIHKTKKEGPDECLKPNVVQRLRGIAKDTGKGLGAVASMPAKQLCRIQGKVWVDGKCVNRKKATADNTVEDNNNSGNNNSGNNNQGSGNNSSDNNGNSGGGDSSGGNDNDQDVGSNWRATCEQYGRKPNGSDTGCAKPDNANRDFSKPTGKWCINKNHTYFIAASSNQYDQCLHPKSKAAAALCKARGQVIDKDARVCAVVQGGGDSNKLNRVRCSTWNAATAGRDVQCPTNDSSTEKRTSLVCSSGKIQRSKTKNLSFGSKPGGGADVIPNAFMYFCKGGDGSSGNQDTCNDELISGGVLGCGDREKKCKAAGGQWLDRSETNALHGGDPCYKTTGAYILNFGTGKVGDGIDQVPLSVGRSEKMNYPNYMIVTDGTWRVCVSTGRGDDAACSSSKGKGVYNLCSSSDRSLYVYDKLTCKQKDVHLRKL